MYVLGKPDRFILFIRIQDELVAISQSKPF